MKLVTLDGKLVKIYDHTRVACRAHGVTTTWKEMDLLARRCFEEGLDRDKDLPCLLLGENSRPYPA